MGETKQKLLLAVGHESIEEWVAQELYQQVEMVGVALDASQIEQHCKEKQPDLLLLSRFLSGQARLEELLITLRKRYGNMRIILLLGQKDGRSDELCNVAISLGIYDLVIGKVTTTQLSKVILHPNGYADVAPLHTKLYSFGAGQQASPKLSLEQEIKILRPRQVVFWAPKGGTGATTLAVSTAVRLAQAQGVKVGLLDFHLQHPHVSAHLGSQDQSGWVNLLASEEMELQDAICSSFGLQALCGHLSPERIPEVSEYLIGEVLHQAKQTFDVTVVDVGPNLDDLTTYLALRLSSIVYVVIDQDLTTIEDAMRAIHWLEKMGIPKTRLRILLNKFQKGDFSDREIAEALEIPIAAIIPFAREAFLCGIRKQKPVVLTQPVLFDPIAEDIMERKVQGSKRRSFFFGVMG